MNELISCQETNLLFKIVWFIDISTTNKIDKITCVIMHDNPTGIDHYETH